MEAREQSVLGRPLTNKEVEHFTHTARRIAAILLVQTNRNEGVQL